MQPEQQRGNAKTLWAVQTNNEPRTWRVRERNKQTATETCIYKIHTHKHTVRQTKAKIETETLALVMDTERALSAQ